MPPSEVPPPGELPADEPAPGNGPDLEGILGGIVAPLFDLALHLCRHPVAAEIAAVAALRDLAADLDAGPLPHPDPLAVAARHLLRAAAGAAPAERPPARNPFDALLGALAPAERTALLVAFALDFDGEDLAWILGVAGDDAHALVAGAKKKMRDQEGAIRAQLDESASATPLPRGLVDRALGE